MSEWTPVWQVTIDGTTYTNVTVANLTVTSGRTDIYSQPYAGYCNLEIINLDQSTITMDINDQITIKVKDSTGTFVNIFGGYVTDIDVEVTRASNIAISESIKVVAMGALSKLPKILTTGVLSKAFDGTQIYDILSQVLFNSWNQVPAALTWATYTPTTTWANAENTGLGEIDRPGNYELTDRASSTTDIYSLVSALATSGLGYLYEDAQGRIGYADSLHRNSYLTTNGYVDLSGNHALARGIKTTKRSGDVRNKVTITYKNGAQQTASDATSINTYGQQAYDITTSLHNLADAASQANFYLTLRAYPQPQFKSITFPISNPEIDDADRNSLLNVFMGLPLNITELPANITGGSFQGFVEGWTFTAAYNSLYLTMTVSPTAYSLQAARWNTVSIVEKWNTLNTGLKWIDATIVA
jgi:hypothetical protein